MNTSLGDQPINRWGLSVRAKLLGVLVIFSLVVALVVSTSLWFNTQTNTILDSMADSAQEHSQSVSAIQEIINTSLIQEGVWNNSLDYDDEELKVSSRDIEAHGLQIMARLQQLQDQFSREESLHLQAAQTQGLDMLGRIEQVKTAYAGFERQSLELGIYNYDNLVTLRQQSEAVSQSLKVFRDSLFVLLAEIEIVEGHLRQGLVDTSSDMADLFQKVFMGLSVGAACVLLLSVVFVEKIIRALYRVIYFIHHAEQHGDFSEVLDVKSHDEVGKVALALNRMMASLQSAFGDVNRVMGAVAEGVLTEQVRSDHQGNLNGSSINEAVIMLDRVIGKIEATGEMIHSATERLTQSSRELAEDTSQQAATLEQITVAMTEIESQTNVNNENALNAQHFSEQAEAIVEQGNQQMASMLDSMGKINQTSAGVTDTIKVIHDIADQTNLLALNAAIEAARAGEHGRGFAIVAQEVRNLAERTTKAAQETSDLIQSSSREVANGSANADLTAKALDQISDIVKQTNGLVSQIVDASAEQQSGVQEINLSLSNVNDVVQNSSSISGDTARVADSLREQVDDMRSTLGHFTLSEAV